MWVILSCCFCDMSFTSSLTSLRTLYAGHAPHLSPKRPRAQTSTTPQTDQYGRPSEGIYVLWATSRQTGAAGEVIAPGAHRAFSVHNYSLASDIIRLGAADLLKTLWALHPWRSLLLVSLELIRGVFPAFRGYSHSLLINELQSVISSEEFLWTSIIQHVAVEICRLMIESIIDSVATENESVVYGSAKFTLEYRQMEKRLKLDLPTLADPAIHDLFRESDLFVRSFGGMSSFGLFSTFDLMRILTSISELVSHILVLSSLRWNGPHLVAFSFSVLTSLLPLLLQWASPSRSYAPEVVDCREARAIAKQERMRFMAQSDSYRQEVLFFGLGPWILQRWARARRIVLGLERRQTESASLARGLAFMNIFGFSSFVQNVPLVLLCRTPAASLGLFTLYQASVHAIFFTTANLVHSAKMAYQGIFLMGAFCAAMEIRPRLQPVADDPFASAGSGEGMKIEVKNVSYTYPGCETPVLQNVNLIIEAGESVAIVGLNGSGKSTLAKILLRMYDYDSGEVMVDGTDIRKYSPDEYHARSTAVFQDFAKFSSSAQENIGVGYVTKMRCLCTVDSALRLAEAKDTVYSLPCGLDTKLDGVGQDSGVCAGDIPGGGPAHGHHGLSGGEWQRIAISRAFMRANRPEVKLLVFDEPTSSLDAHAQARIFDNIEKMCRPGAGERRKTVIFITHRLSTARRADKIAMMENGTICEFGTHQELLRRKGKYAALYQASI